MHAGECVLAPNASVMTLDGTNTWVLREPDSSRSVVVDPGRRSCPTSMRSSRLRVRSRSCCSPTTTPITPRRRGSSPSGSGAAYARWTRRTGWGPRAWPAVTWSRSTGWRSGWSRRQVTARTRCRSCCRRTVRASPGTRCSGRGTTVVAHPDGQLGAYLDSLDRLHALASEHEITTIWPGHGPVIDDALPVLDYYLAHRQERLEQVESALADPAPPPTPRGSPSTSCRARSSRSCTPTWTRSSGVPPSSPSAPSSPTSRLVELGLEVSGASELGKMAPCAGWEPSRAPLLQRVHPQLEPTPRVTYS